MKRIAERPLSDPSASGAYDDDDDGGDDRAYPDGGLRFFYWPGRALALFCTDVRAAGRRASGSDTWPGTLGRS